MGAACWLVSVEIQSATHLASDVAPPSLRSLGTMVPPAVLPTAQGCHSPLICKRGTSAWRHRQMGAVAPLWMVLTKAIRPAARASQAKSVACLLLPAVFSISTMSLGSPECQGAALRTAASLQTRQCRLFSRASSKPPSSPPQACTLSAHKPQRPREIVH